MKKRNFPTPRPRRIPPKNARSVSILRSALIVSVLMSTAIAGTAGLLLSAGNNDKEGSKGLLSELTSWILGRTGPPERLQVSREYIYSDSRLLAIERGGSLSGHPSDLAVWRPSTGTWWVINGFSSAVTAEVWGIGEDLPSSGDFDGDGKTDLCVFRPSTGTWWIHRSSDNSNKAISFGVSGDHPVPADYDGDGVTDIAVWRPSNGTWHTMESGTGRYHSQAFGAAGDVPSPADLDGDGLADRAVWRGSQKSYHWIGSSDLALRTRVLPSGGGPVPADYDGDGRDDAAVRSGSSWIIHSSLTGEISSFIWGSPDDTAVENDYDGDGRVDIAVWRSADGAWLIRNSSDGMTRTVMWGKSGDIPVPAFYRR